MKRIGSLDIAKNLKLRGKVVDKLVVEGGFYSQQFGETAYKSDLTGLGSGASGTGFYGIVVKDTSNTQKFRGINLLNFNFDQFYLTQNSPNTDEAIINVRALGLTGPAGPAGPAGASGGLSEITDGVNSNTNITVLNLNHNNFYLTTDLAGEPVVNWDLKNGFQEVETELDGDGRNIYWDWSDSNSYIVRLQKNCVLHTPSGLGRRAAQVNLVVAQPLSGFYNMTFGKKFIFPGGDSQDYTTEEAGAIDVFSFHFSPSLNKIMVLASNDLFY